MTETQEQTGLEVVLGAPAALERELVSRVRALRAREPLSPIVVLVGGILQRPHLARLLADELGGHANVLLLTVGELGLRLGEPRLVLEGRRPLPALAERVLTAETARGAGGYFAGIAHAPGFAEALRRLFRELRQEGIDPPAFRAALLGAAESPAKAESLAALYDAYERARAGRYAGDDCLRAADPAGLDAAAVLVTGIERLGAVARTLLEHLAERLPVTVLLPDLGETANQAHAELRAWLAPRARRRTLSAAAPASALAHLQARLFAAAGPAAPADGTVTLLSAPDPAAETREAARACLAWAAEGVAFREMAVVYRRAAVYRPLVEATFAEAGIPVYLHDGASLAERPIGRRTLALLDLIGSPLRRRDVMRFATDGRLPDALAARYAGSGPRWEAISRRAGVVEGFDQWRERLHAFRERERQRYGDDPPEWLAGRLAEVDGLAAFVADLRDRLDAIPARSAWSGHLDALGALLRDYVRDGEQVAGYLDGLRTLDGILGEVDRDRFLAVVRAEVEQLRTTDLEEGRQGAFARRGVNVLDANQLRHLSFRAVCVLGLAERAFPPPPSQDPVLLDDERERLRGAFPTLPLRVRGADPEPLQFALAVHAARERLQLSYPRAEESGGRARLPSPFFRAAAAALVGRRVRTDELDRLGLLVRRPAGRVGAPAPVLALSAAEYDRTLLETEPALGRALLTRSSASYARAAEARRALFRSRELTAYDGILEAPEALAALAQHAAAALSPTNLERYATCPHRFLLSVLLGLAPVEEPEAIERIAPSDRGSVVHAILERFLSELGDAGLTGAAEAHLGRLREIAGEELDGAEAAGVTGHPLLWRYDRQGIVEDVEAWLRSELGAGAGYERRAYEVGFGPARPGQPTAAERVVVPAGSREVAFRGTIDRLEWTPGGGFRVVDYKSGSLRGRTTPSLDGGRRLQLAVYLHAGAAIAGTAVERGTAEYLYVSRREGFRQVVMAGDFLAARADALAQILERLVGGIAEGDFHRTPSAETCRWCDFRGVCPAAKEWIAERKSADPRVATLADLRALG